MFAPLGFDNEKFKTELCVKFLELGQCPYNTRCRFAHGEAELRQKPKPKQYKTKPCNNFLRTGICPYGVRCNFLHGDPNEIQMQQQHQQQLQAQAQAQAQQTQNQQHVFNNIGLMQPPPQPLTSVPNLPAVPPQTRNATTAMHVDESQMTYQQKMRHRQRQGWENYMTGLKHSCGCYNVKTIRGFHCERPPMSDRFQAWKEMRGEGELPEHVLILQDNEAWIMESKHKQKSAQILMESQQQIQHLSKLLTSAGANTLSVSKPSNTQPNGEGDNEEDDDEEDDSENASDSSTRKKRKRRRRKHSSSDRDRSRRRHRKRRRRHKSSEEEEQDEDEEDDEDGDVKVKKERDTVDNDNRLRRSRSRSRSRHSSDQNRSDVKNENGERNEDELHSHAESHDKSPSFDGEDEQTTLSEMPLPE
eukprot:CAMPEP_0202690844 /NCGR_PEP_ID=MMETSP1385-20130828/5729_1 /ASSEMBLY_ACC=CAM_ASM_000861 /TAXON_ID=933848 /ORGANISM="Elphidium margaritaceum" /LENGTH=416 /DNA_ID=CAMNT_0049346159 /DNA_START=2750 /DNA_END=4000 /DNA_ORIENTATION=+